MAHEVFISYSSKDKPVADAICSGVESRGMRGWMAPRDILPGATWGEAIVNAIRESKVMVLVLSSSSNESVQVLREVERAVNKGVIILPFRCTRLAREPGADALAGVGSSQAGIKLRKKKTGLSVGSTRFCVCTGWEGAWSAAISGIRYAPGGGRRRAGGRASSSRR
jgi:hypothetical protein